ncbi:hypothetical protein AGDE_14081 [Angomonas deanei]|nr:hypothetical protein AGDE_14081 [Angomonas deanei]|eukprot:EPY21451.1 hypothetical protein AGDE_14081 [Angomonas deanei]
MLNVHTTPNITSRRVLVTLLVCYRLPLLILCSSWIMILCYNAFFLSVVKQEVFSDASSSFSVNVRRLTMLCLTVEDVLFALLYWSFFRAVFTAPDTIDATVWAHPPQANKMQQKWDEVIWSRQQGWFEEQRREREAAAQYQRQQLERLLEEPPSVEVEVTEEKPSPPAPNPSSSSGGLSSRGGGSNTRAPKRRRRAAIEIPSPSTRQMGTYGSVGCVIFTNRTAPITVDCAAGAPLTWTTTVCT